jgi:hypothetical protein
MTHSLNIQQQRASDAAPVLASSVTRGKTMPDGSNFAVSPTSSLSPAIERPVERAKLPWELIEYRASLFETSLDEADGKAPWLDGVGHTGPSPEVQRLRDLLPGVVAIIEKPDASARVRHMIKAMGLSLPRLERLRSCSVPRWADRLEDRERKAYALINQVSSEMLLEVKPKNGADLKYLMALAMATELPKAKQRALLGRFTDGLRKAMAGEPIDGRWLGVLEATTSDMAPRYPEGSKFVVSRVKRSRDVVLGRDYCFEVGSAYGVASRLPASVSRTLWPPSTSSHPFAAASLTASSTSLRPRLSATS